jgi:hypothetical protein
MLSIITEITTLGFKCLLIYTKYFFPRLLLIFLELEIDLFSPSFLILSRYKASIRLRLKQTTENNVQETIGRR